MMKVLITTMHLPLNKEEINGGVSSAIFNLLSGFAFIEDLEVHVLTFNKNITNDIHLNLDRNITIHYEPYKLLGINSVDFVLTSIRLINKYNSQLSPNIIHYQTHGFSLLMRMFLVGTPIKEIITIHGITKLEAKFTKRKSIKYVNILNEYLDYFLLPRNAIFISKYSQVYFTKYKLRNSTVIFNSVNEIFVNHNVVYIDKRRLLYVGKISPLKNLMLVLKALVKLRQENILFHINVIGTFSDIEYKCKVFEYINKHKINDQITFQGQKSQFEIAHFLESTSALVVSSLHENLPVVIAETMAANRTVIASNVGGISEIIIHGETGFLFNSNDIDSLCNTLIQYLDSDLSEICRKARLFASVNFNARTNAERVYRFYCST